MNDLIVRVLDKERAGEGLFEVYEDFTCDTSIGPVTVTKGYVTDFASIPRPFRWLLPQCGHSSVAALLHDWLLHVNDKRATRVFSEELKVAGAGIIRRYMMVAFVFLFTWPSTIWPQKG